MAGGGKAAERPPIHGEKGAYCGGEFVAIEECDKVFNVSKGSASKCADCPCPRSRTRHVAAKEDGSYDVVIVGAGCIGAAIARELSKTTASVLVLEAADDVTQGATKGNSGIVHAGYDDKPGSVRSKFCWPGNQMFPQLDRELRFGYQRNGSLVVAYSDEDLDMLNELKARGDKNGVQNLKIIDRDELRKLEPHINPAAIGALLSPDAGTLTPYEYTIALAENAADNGVEFRIRREVTAISRDDGDGKFTVTARHWEPKAYASSSSLVGLFRKLLLVLGLPIAAAVGMQLASPGAAVAVVLAVVAVAQFLGSSGAGGAEGIEEKEEYRCSLVVNAAGCKSDTVARMVGDDSFKIKPRMGEYLLLHKNQGHLARHTLFPTPGKMGKGVLVQQTLWGNLILGPTARDLHDPAFKETTSEQVMSYILSKCRLLVPEFDAKQTIHTFSGLRAKSDRGDWIIEESKKCHGFINVAGIDSPGLAGSPAIAVEVMRLLSAAGFSASPDPSFEPNRQPLITPKNGWRGIKAGPVGKYTDPKQNVVCKCEKVTEAEIVEALRRSLPVDSTQAIRRRTRAGMGHCQAEPGNYDCEARVAAIIARETGTHPKSVGRRPWPATSFLPQRWLTDSQKEDIEALAPASCTADQQG